MAHATGTRLLAGFFFLLSLIPPWIQAIVTVPLWIGLWRKANRKEKERERELQALEEQAS